MKLSIENENLINQKEINENLELNLLNLNKKYDNLIKENEIITIKYQTNINDYKKELKNKEIKLNEFQDSSNTMKKEFKIIEDLNQSLKEDINTLTMEVMWFYYSFIY